MGRCCSRQASGSAISLSLTLDANCGSTRSSERYVFRPNGPRLVFPNAVMQYAVPDLDKLSIDQVALTQWRDRLLLSAGYSVLVPEGTFYLWSKWTDNDPQQWNALADRDVFVLPGSMMNAPGYFRISLTASDEMVERALPGFYRGGMTLPACFDLQNTTISGLQAPTSRH